MDDQGGACQLQWLSRARDDFLGIPDQAIDAVREVIRQLKGLSEFPPPISLEDDDAFLLSPVGWKDWWIARASNGYDVYVRSVSRPDEELCLEIGQIIKATPVVRKTRVSREVLDKLAELVEGEEEEE
jgi:hypothetical protein